MFRAIFSLIIMSIKTVLQLLVLRTYLLPAGIMGVLFQHSHDTSRQRPDHDQQHCYHHAPKVKPEAAAAVVGLLMMDVKTPETY
jgi:hypothetical protein